MSIIINNFMNFFSFINYNIGSGDPEIVTIYISGYSMTITDTWTDGSCYGSTSSTYLRTGDNFYFRSNNNTSMGSVDGDGGYWTFYSGSDQTQTTYRVEVRGSSGLNLNASEGLSSGQKTTVLRAGGDKLWIDTYGVFQKNRNTVTESITIVNGDNCSSNGPITINNGITVTINSGGNWTIV